MKCLNSTVNESVPREPISVWLRMALTEAPHVYSRTARGSTLITSSRGSWTVSSTAVCWSKFMKAGILATGCHQSVADVLLQAGA